MKKISDGEENEMYKLLSDSLFAFCESKPKNSIEYLARTLLTVANEDPELIKTFVNKNNEKVNTGYLLKEDKITPKNKSFNQEYRILKKIGFGTLGDVFLAEEKKNPGTTLLKKKIRGLSKL